ISPWTGPEESSPARTRPGRKSAPLRVAAKRLLFFALSFLLGLEFLDFVERLVRIRQRFGLAAVAAEEHRLIFDHDLDRRAHFAEPVIRRHAPLLRLDQRPVLFAHFG